MSLNQDCGDSTGYINNLRYTDDTTLFADCEEELKSQGWGLAGLLCCGAQVPDGYLLLEARP